MNVKIIAPFTLIGIILSVSIVLWSAGEKSLIPKEEKIWEDERIGITLDKLERTDSYPSELKTPGQEYSSAKEGYDFVFIHLTIAHIEGVHLGLVSKETTLVDAESREYKAANAKFPIQLKDLTDISAGYKIVEGSSGFVVFEIPEHAEPVDLKFVYPYSELGEEKTMHGQIDIKISQNK